MTFTGGIMTHLIRSSLVVAVALVPTGRGAAQNKPIPPEVAKLGSPGTEHEQLRALFGTETWFVTAIPEGGTAGQPGTAIYKSILGGRFVTEK
jgi:hypothetical protein